MKTVFTVKATNTNNMIIVNCGACHPLDRLEETLFTHYGIKPATNRCSWAFPFLRGEYVRFVCGDRKFRVWAESSELVWVKEI
jgi:hypothetical protein